MSKQATTVLS